MNVLLQVTNYYLLDALTTIIAATTPPATKLSGAKHALGTALLTPSLITTFADIVEATFTGYAESAVIVWGLPINSTDGTPTSPAPSHTFRCTTSGTPNMIQNVAITDGVASPNQGLLACGTVTPAIQIANVGDGLTVQVNWNLYYGNGQNFASVAQ